MTKDSLIAFVSERARISAQRAELAYEAFWEAILSELKTGHFSLPVGKGTLQIRSKNPASLPDEKVKVIAKKTEKKTRSKPIKGTPKKVKKSKTAAKVKSKSKDTNKKTSKVKAKKVPVKKMKQLKKKK